MTRARLFPLLATVAAALTLAGCTGGDPGEANPDDISEARIRAVAVPNEPAVAHIGVDEDTSSVKLDVTLTVVANATDDNATANPPSPEPRPATVRVVLLAGPEEVFNESYEVTPEKGAVIAESFGDDVVQKALDVDENLITLRVFTDAATVSVDGYLRANRLL